VKTPVYRIEFLMNKLDNIDFSELWYLSQEEGEEEGAPLKAHHHMGQAGIGIFQVSGNSRQIHSQA